MLMRNGEKAVMISNLAHFFGRFPSDTLASMAVKGLILLQLVSLIHVVIDTDSGTRNGITQGPVFGDIPTSISNTDDDKAREKSLCILIP